MRLLGGLPSFVPVQLLLAFCATGAALGLVACGDDSENTRTTNSLTDASADARVDEGADAGVDASRDESSEVPTSSTSEPEDASTPERDAAPTSTDTSETADVATSSEMPDTTNGEPDAQAPTSTAPDTSDSSEPPLPESCGNGELDGSEMCCRQSAIDATLLVRFEAAELLLNGDLGCAPPQSNQQDSVSYEMCQNSCGTDVGCAVSASNVELTYDTNTKRFSGIADVVIEGSVALTLAALNQSVNCEQAHILFEEVTFGGVLVTEIGQESASVDVRDIASKLGIPRVTGCAQGNVISAAFLLMQGPIETAVAEAVENALEGTVAQPVDCPY
jgi:hypothetical protein